MLKFTSFQYQTQMTKNPPPFIIDPSLSILWSSRAGQGAITASTVLAEILGKQGKYVQSFPDFGAEKRGAVVAVYNRISNKIIEDVSHPTELDAIVLLDTTLISSNEISEIDIFSKLKKDGILLVNTSQAEFTLSTKFEKVFALNADKIAKESIGKNIPNVPILGALVRVLNLASQTQFSKELKKYLSAHLPAEIVAGNLKAFERGFAEVQTIKINLKTPKKSDDILPNWQDIPLGAVIQDAGNSVKYNTGNWTRQTCKWNSKTCINCKLCWPVCPHDAIRTDADGNMIGVDESKCTACELCVAVCPTKPKSLELI
jgi:pyruvate ferredoxin oxidoreductase gamma subunit